MENQLLRSNCTKHAILIDTNACFNTRYLLKSPRVDFSSEICSKPLDRGEGARIYITF